MCDEGEDYLISCVAFIYFSKIAREASKLSNVKRLVQVTIGDADRYLLFPFFPCFHKFHNGNDASGILFS